VLYSIYIDLDGWDGSILIASNGWGSSDMRYLYKNQRQVFGAAAIYRTMAINCRFWVIERWFLGMDRHPSD
jgi:hypothetical protein